MAPRLEITSFLEARLPLPSEREFASSTWPTASARTRRSSLAVTRTFTHHFVDQDQLLTASQPGLCSHRGRPHRRDCYCSQSSRWNCESCSLKLKVVLTVTFQVLFGYTQNQQNRGGVPNYPSDRLEVFCAFGDLVCDGTLTITAAHLSYSDEAAGEAPRFLASKIGA